MATRTPREQILAALQDLPADASFDDAIERLVFLAKIEAGLLELDAGERIPHDEVRHLERTGRYLGRARTARIKPR